MKLPNEYIVSCQEIFQEEYEEYLACFKKKPYDAVKINTNKYSAIDFNKDFGNHKQVLWDEDGFEIDNKKRYSTHPYFYAGLFYIQDPSAMLPASILPIKENDVVLDCCASPGGKTIKLANKLKGTGLLIANDISAKRAIILDKNLKKAGVYNCVVTNNDLLDFKLDETFDAILLDAPCSGEGMFRKDETLIKAWLKNNDYVDIQKKLISKCYKLLKSGGYLVYSTCTFNLKENEEIIEYALTHFDLKVIDPKKTFQGIVYGKTANTKDAIRLYPHKINGEGQFCCLMQKKGESNTNTFKESCDFSEIKDITKYLNTKHSIITKVKDNYYLRSNVDLNYDSLNIISDGILIGGFKNNRFVPEKTLAYYLKSFSKTVNLKLDDQRVIRYLKGETIFIDEDISGIVLVIVNNKPLGFGDILNKQMKNLIDKSMRML